MKKKKKRENDETKKVSLSIDLQKLSQNDLIELKKFHIHDLLNLETLSEVQMRIKIIALVHEKLYKSEQFSNINLNDYLIELTSYYKNIFNKSNGESVNFKIE